jgi:hypothetical protein
MKSFVMCVIVFFVCSVGNAHVDYSHQYEMAYKQRPRKSVRNIVKEILNRKAAQKKKANTVPVPLYDSIDFERVKNLA